MTLLLANYWHLLAVCPIMIWENPNFDLNQMYSNDISNDTREWVSENEK